ncbi:MAG: hypothetical protein A2145_03670 [candidate division Zixibacteria bacterium RBG_16_40_9]|nr:MAG: hypothetical protein A2145_03670 [candidate division Zixibacteria bacterium RBG_16_40_9]
MLSRLFFWISMIILLLFASVLADRKSYVWTYEYHTTPRGELELENYLDFEAPHWKDKSTSTWKNQIELEYGITRSWDIALYQVFSQTSSGPYKFSQMKLRTRYGLGKYGIFGVDPVLYLEYKRPADASAASVLEGKLILAKDLNKFNLAGNLTLEKELASGTEWENEYSWGSSYHFVPAFKAGIEMTGNFESKEQNRIELGPTLSFEGKKFFITTGMLWGLNDTSNDFRFRYILGLEL